MVHRKLRKAFFASAVVLITGSSSAYAKPSVDWFEPRGHVAFSDAAGRDFDLASAPTADGGRVFGDSPAKGAFVDKIATADGSAAFSWNRADLKATWRHAVLPVSAIPEPSIDAMLISGIAGIVVVMLRRRPRGR